ncbi:hypothetical protein PO909_033600 [Leuciscus waleckii]
MMLLVQTLPISDYVIQLYDWFVEADQCIIVMEYPDPCVTLLDFILQNGGQATETVAKDIMRKVAAQHCTDRGVLHSDIHLKNILIKIDTAEADRFCPGSSHSVFRKSHPRR